MYFFKEKGKQILDLRGDLILTHNPSLVMGRVKSAAPKAVRNANRIEDITNMSFVRKVRATRAAIGFIWGDSQALTTETIDKEKI